NGFGGEEFIVIDFGTSMGIAGVNSNSNGSFNVAFPVDTQASGSLTVWATGEDWERRDDHLFIITGITMVQPSSGPVSTVVTLSGAGYYANEYVQIDIGTAININKPMTDGNGKFYTTFTINDPQFYGIKTITAVGLTSNRSDIDFFKITPRIYSISPTRGTIGTPIIIKGDGWEPSLNYQNTAYPDTVWMEVDFGDHAYMGFDPDNLSISPRTSALGTFTAVIADAEPQPGGNIYVTVLEADNASLNDRVSFYIEGEITKIEPSMGTVGCQVMVEGRGYGKLEGVCIDFGTSYGIVPGANNKATDQGAFSTTFTINMQSYGSTSVRATGEQSRVTVTKPFVILPNIVTLNPNNGFTGMVITVEGNGFGQSEAIKIGFGTTPTIQTTSTDVYGWFKTTFTVDVQAKGDVSISMLGLDSKAIATSTFLMQSGITLVTPSIGTVGMTVTVYGAGFWPNMDVRIDFGKTIYISVGPVSSMGTFCATFVVNSQAYGTTTIVAMNYSGSLTSDEDCFFIQGNVATAVPVSGTVGKAVTITGAGYAYNEKIEVKFGTTIKIASTTSSFESSGGNGGTFATTFTVDVQSYGNVTIEAVGKSSGAKGNRPFSLGGSITQITPSIGTVGTWVSIIGNGYAATETIRIDLGTTKTITVGTASAGGSFSTRFMVDNQPYGTTTVTVYGNTSKQQINGKFKVIQRITNISPFSGVVGRVVTVIGDGYHSRQGINLSFGSTASIASAVIGQNGRFEAVFTVDLQPYGSRTVQAIDTEGLTSEVSFKIIPNISVVSPSQSPVGATISIEGNGFAKQGSNGIFLRFAGNLLQGNILHGDENGWFKGSFVVDSQPQGTATIQCIDLDSSAVAENYLLVIPKIISITPVSCSVGSVVSIVGAGFMPTDAITVGFGTASNIGNIISSSMGTFSLEFTVDVQPYGTATLIAMGTATRVEEYLNILPRVIMVSPSQGTIGTQVIIMGNGYGASDVILIDFGKTPSIRGTTANEIGEWTAGFVIDIQAYGNTIISAKGEKASTGTSSFTILPELIQVEPASGTIGTHVVVKGQGYAASETVSIRFGNNMEPIIEVMTDNLGIFTTVFVVDTQSYGTCTINAIGTISSSSNNYFFVMPQFYGVTPISGTIGVPITI
ncbi:hypothetical protein COZ13_02340, partial [Candidatus Desantisbacteria bacterium CG_4_10_14_3_um_filter_40_18]